MKMKCLLIALLTTFSLSAQQKMIVYLKDKPSNQLIQLSQRGLDRRARQGVSMDEYDVQIDANYLSALAKEGTLLNTSRWLNAVALSTEMSAADLMEKYSFIRTIKEVKSNAKSTIDKTLPMPKALNYGPAWDQTNQINIDCMHAMGYTGSGVYLAVIDAGFINMDSIPYFDSLYLQGRVLDTFNFVHSDSSIYTWSGHGTAVSSCIVGNGTTPVDFAGTAIDVDMALYVAEDVFSETELEEFNVVAALERCDSVGVDVANISLGYKNFDDSLTNHPYSDMDGNTTIAAIGVNVAVSRGIAVVTSAGNGGPGTISTPCDADGALCVGAVDSLGQYAFFSSVGPSFDGQVKPDVAARGFGSRVVIITGDVVPGNGTSFSSPITAGAMACLIQANPTATVAQLYAAVQQSASQFSSPDSLLGYGIPDFCEAHGILNNSTGYTSLASDDFTLYPVPADALIHVQLEAASEEGKQLYVFNMLGEVVLVQPIIGAKAQIDVSALSNGLYTIQVGSTRKKTMIIH